MALNHGSGLNRTHQPFQCSVCQARFTRLENLKRHAASHARSHDEPSFVCEVCQVTFSRRDLRQRHLKRKHPELEDAARDPKRARPEPPERSASSSAHESEDDMDETSRMSALWSQAQDLDSGNGGWQYNVPPQTLQSNSHWHDHGNENSTLDMCSSRPQVMSWRRDSAQSNLHSHGHKLFEPKQSSQPAPIATDESPYSTSPVHVQDTVPGATPAATSDSGALLRPFSSSLSPRNPEWAYQEWLPSDAQVRRGVELYFLHVSGWLPVIHRPTIDLTQVAPDLLLSMLSLAYQHGEDPDVDEGSGSGAALSLRCFYRARVLAESVDHCRDDMLRTVTLAQTYLLLQICAMFYLGGEHAVHGLKMHCEMVSLARTGGLMQRTSSDAAIAKDLESLWLAFVNGEAHKRTVLAMHQVDALYYQLLSIPRSMSHLEVAHDLPCPESYWTASSAANWAHQQLMLRGSDPSVRYGEAVRRILSSEGRVSLPQFDRFGTVNVAQFLVSSAREISGWCAMTGSLSLDRFELLKSALVSLEPFVRPHETESRKSQTGYYEATWEMAMIEHHMGSLSHTCGLVAGSVDAMLDQLTQQASSGDFLCGDDTARTVQPHLDWFLRRLDDDLDEDSEPPWVLLYAYKAFLIAVQLVSKRYLSAMQAVGIRDGDTQTAIAWARTVFHRRSTRQLGKSILMHLDVLNP